MSLRDYMRELEELEAKQADEAKETSFTDLFKGEEAPTQEELDAYAEENDLSPEEVSEKIIKAFFDLVNKEEKEEESEEDETDEESEESEDEEDSDGEEKSEKKGCECKGKGGADADVFGSTKAANGEMYTKAQFEETDPLAEEEYDDMTEEESPEHEAEETPEEEEAAEHEEGGEEELPFAKGDTVSYNTDDPDSMLYGKKLEVVSADENGFVQVIYLDADGNPTEMWFKNDEVTLESKGDGGATEDEVVVPQEESVEEVTEEEEPEETNESFGVAAFLKSGLKYFRG